MPAQYQVRKAADRQFRFNLTADTHRAILSRETYKATRGVEPVMRVTGSVLGTESRGT